MRYPIAPAWLLGSRLLNQSQIGLWAARCEYIFLRLHRRESASALQRATAMPYDCREDVDVTLTQACRRTRPPSLMFALFFVFYVVRPGPFLFLIFSPSLLPSTSITLCLFALSLFPFLLSPSGQRLSFKVLILI